MERKLISYFAWEANVMKEANSNVASRVAVINRLMKQAEEEKDDTLYDLAENIMDCAKFN